MGQELVNVLSEIVRDGLATEAGFRRLQQWLGERPDGQLPAVDFLSRVVGERASKPKFTTRDLFELQFAVERVLPHPLRDRVAAKRQSAWSRARATENRVESLHDLGGTPAAGMTKEEAPALTEPLQPRPTEKQVESLHDLGGTPAAGMTKEEAPAPTEPLQPRPTEKQLETIRDLGGTAPPGISRGQASELIDRLLAEAETRPTPRQIMVLRFWNRMDLSNGPKNRIAEWLEGFYKEDPRRKLAWEMFKIEAGDDGSHPDPSTVPIGAGETYLGKMSIQQAMETQPAPAETEERFCKCPCGSCDVNIEFPAHGIGQTVACPKCGSDTLLFDSSQAGQEAAQD